MKKVIEQIERWQFMQSLPREISGFVFNQEQEQRMKYHIFSYENAALRRKVSVMYDPATKDFGCLFSVGLSEFYDVEFMTADFLRFEQLLASRLSRSIRDLAVFSTENLGNIFCDKKILQWKYGRQIPSAIEGFSLFIRPEEPVKTINGSYIILDYSDFPADSNLIVYYNIYRDEFFGETKLRGRPQTTSRFDARTLEELQTVLDKELASTLHMLRLSIIQAADK